MKSTKKKVIETEIKMKRKLKNLQGVRTPLAYFVLSTYTEYIQANPNDEVNLYDLVGRCEEVWNSMEDERKRPFVELSNNDRKRYDKESIELLTYFRHKLEPTDDSMNEDHLAIGSATKSVKKEENESGMIYPKKPPTAFLRFLNESNIRKMIKEQNPGIKASEINKRCSEVWRCLPDDEKKVYNDRFATDMKVYRSKLASLQKGVNPDFDDEESNEDPLDLEVEELVCDDSMMMTEDDIEPSIMDVNNNEDELLTAGEICSDEDDTDEAEMGDLDEASEYEIDDAAGCEEMVERGTPYDYLNGYLPEFYNADDDDDEEDYDMESQNRTNEPKVPEPKNRRLQFEEDEYESDTEEEVAVELSMDAKNTYNDDVENLIDSANESENIQESFECDLYK